MKGKVIRQKWITRDNVIANKSSLFVFGDNMERMGYGGQAGAMRGAPNSVGIPTKWSPGMSSWDFFSDADLPVVRPVLDAEFAKLMRHLEGGGNVVIPSDGLGTGLSQLRQRAPAVLDYIESTIDSLVEFSNE